MQSLYALDVDELITKKQNEASEKEQADNYKKSLKGTIELYMQSHSYPTIQDFLMTAQKVGRYGQEEWKSGWQLPLGNINGEVFETNYDNSGEVIKNSAYQAVARSYLIKTLLEKEYGLSIPFETDSIEKDFGPITYEMYHPNGKQKISCASKTPALLSGGIVAIGNYTESTFPAGNKKMGAWELEYIANLFGYLKIICDEEDRTLNGENSFIKAYKKFLNDYAAALEAGHQEDQAKLAKEEAERKAAEAEKRAALEKSQQTNQIAQNEHASALRSGKIKPRTIEDAKLLWQPSDGFLVVLSPPVTADSNNYLLSGKLVRIEGSRHVFEVNTGNDIKYFICVIQRDSIQAKGTLLRYERGATIVGKFVGVDSYTTVAGETRMAPVFNTLLIQN